MAPSQDEVFAFLMRPAAWPEAPERVETIDTHGARVFLAGGTVLKVKRAVRLPYLDFSTLDARRHFCERELALNGGAASGIYRDVVAITREPSGALAIAGQGTPVEYAVRMNRFSQDDLAINAVRRGAFSREMAEDLADGIYRYHAGAPIAAATAENIADVCGNVQRSLRAHLAQAPELSDRLDALFQSHLKGELRARRAAAGCVRRCHGDLHLGNIVLWQGRPVLFDALEFDEGLATIDTLYDLAFVIMDLDRHGARDLANAALNRYLWRSRAGLDVEGLALLPLYLGLRAAIRAMVTFDRILSEPANTNALRAEALAMTGLAVRDLSGGPACVIATGGLSGTGKTTVSRALAPLLGAVPGALHLRSDMERKALEGVEPLERLPASSYTRASSAGVYARLFERARIAVAAGHAVVLDAVFAHADERAAAEDIARAAGVPFFGIWLEGPPEMLKSRVGARSRDASDATPEVVTRQLSYDVGDITWARLDTSGGAAATITAARALLHNARLFDER